MGDSNPMRIVLLGKTGSGKSSLAKTMFGKEVFPINHDANSETNKCQIKTGSVNEKEITVIDTPGFFDTDRSEEEMRAEIVRCIVECAPGPHAFLIVLKVERFTKHEQDVVTEIHQIFSEEVFKYATVLFTHGDQLNEGQTIRDFVSKNEFISDLVKKCGGRCHVFDNKYWNQNSEDTYRSNQFQMKELLKTIENTYLTNNGGCYTNEMLQAVETEIQQEKEYIRQSSRNMPEEEITRQAKDSVFKKFLIRAAGVATGVLLGALFGVLVFVGAAGLIISCKLKAAGAAAAAVAAAGAAAGTASIETAAAAAAAKVTGTAVAGTTVKTLVIVTGTGAAVGAVCGGYAGYNAAEGAETPWEASKKAATAVSDGAKIIFEQAKDCHNKTSKLQYSKS